jgi:hypothetical protein
MGVPQCIEGKQYERNALLFNVVFIFHKPKQKNSQRKEDQNTIPAYNISIDTDTYKPIVRKLAFVFRTLEVQREQLLTTKRLNYNFYQTNIQKYKWGAYSREYLMN